MHHYPPSEEDSQLPPSPQDSYKYFVLQKSIKGQRNAHDHLKQTNGKVINLLIRN